MKHKNKQHTKHKELRDHLKQDKIVYTLYVILSILVIITFVRSFFRGDYMSCFVCVLTSILFITPTILEKRLNIEIPTLLQSIILVFIFAAEILGEINSYYIIFPYWDTMLHTINGFLCSAVGFGLLDILNQNNKIKFYLSPIYLAIMSFCFSMTIGVLWEFFEFSCDMLLMTDMQKDFIVNNISSVTLDPEGKNNPVLINDIVKTIIETSSGEKIIINGYLDIGIIDTIKDLFVNFIGAIIFSIIGYFYVKTKGKVRLAKELIPYSLDKKED